jgi:hypothetical protein
MSDLIYQQYPKGTSKTGLLGIIFSQRSGDLCFIDEDNFAPLLDRVEGIVLRGAESVANSELPMSVLGKRWARRYLYQCH